MRTTAALIAIALCSLTACATQAEAPSDVPDAVQNEVSPPAPDEKIAAAPSDSPVIIGALPPDFPKDVFPLTPTDEVLLSALTPAGPNQQTLSLNVRTTAQVDEILATYQESLTAAGFQAADPTEVEGLAVQQDFEKDDEKLTLGILDEKTSRIISIGGTIARE
ncbi:MAG TPA: hypothetical protein VK030_03075 [Actinomycetales bacterium]|nr:hypothetical protein [Actinomycetales bacterium]